MRKYIDAAIVIGRKNLDGRLVVKATAGLPFMLKEGMTLHFVPPQLDVPRESTVESVTDRQGESAVLSLSGIDDVSTADALSGCHVLIDAACVDPSVLVMVEQGADHSLVGWRIEDETSGISGIVVSAEDLPTQTLLSVDCQCIQGDARDPEASQGQCSDDSSDRVHLVPLVDEFVVDANNDERILKVSLPKGIFEL